MLRELAYRLASNTSCPLFRFAERGRFQSEAHRMSTINKLARIAHKNTEAAFLLDELEAAAL